jgi:hypothetical protein
MLAGDIADRIAIATPDELDGIVRDMWVDHRRAGSASSQWKNAADLASGASRISFASFRRSG